MNRGLHITSFSTRIPSIALRIIVVSRLLCSVTPTIPSFLGNNQKGQYDKVNVQSAWLDSQNSSFLLGEKTLFNRLSRVLCNLAVGVDLNKLLSWLNKPANVTVDKRHTTKPTPLSDFHLYSTPSFPIKYRELCRSLSFFQNPNKRLTGTYCPNRLFLNRKLVRSTPRPPHLPIASSDAPRSVLLIIVGESQLRHSISATILSSSQSAGRRSTETLGL